MVYDNARTNRAHTAQHLVIRLLQILDGGVGESNQSSLRFGAHAALDAGNGGQPRALHQPRQQRRVDAEGHQHETRCPERNLGGKDEKKGGGV